MSSGDNAQPAAADSVARHASVTELELAFAQNPESTAYVDLCLAYIDQGRFMEAMVVCKKGVKAHPESVDARVLLARVYAAQKKYKKALQELDEVVTAFASSAEAYLARGKMRIESGDETGAIDDLKKAIDLDKASGTDAVQQDGLKPKALSEATKLLADRGIEYPEKPKIPDPPPPPPPQPAGGYPMPGAPFAPPQFGGHTPPFQPAFGGNTPPLPSFSPYGLAGAQPDGAPPLPRGVSQIPGVSTTADLPNMPPALPNAALPRGVSVVPYYPQAGLQYMPVPRLEGEEELEEMANKIAVEKPDRGRAGTSIALAVILGVVGAGLIGYRFYEKRKVEAIDRLTSDALTAFNQDTYGSYKTAAGYLEQILNQHDSKHALTLGRLAHCYAILWGEHGEVALKPKLDELLKRAEKDAPEVSHTVAARGLAILYDGKDRQANAAKAREALAPVVQKVKELDGAPSYADLTLAIADLELGDYENATQTLGSVKQVLPGSVRAKVWHARAAFRANRLGTAEAAFMEALRAQPGHPGARAGLALAKMVRGDLNGAAESILKFDELPGKEISDRDRALAEFARSMIFRAAGEESKSSGAYEMAVRLDPGNADFPYGLGKSLVDNDHAKEALPYLKKAVDLEKTRATFLITLAEAEMMLEDNKSAEKHVEDAVKKAPNFLEAALAKARFYRRTKNAETENYLKKVLEQWPAAEAEVSLELGRYYRAIGKLDDAKSSLEKAIDKMSGYPPTKQADIVLSYAKLMKERNENEIAAKSYKQAAELGSLEASFWLADMLARSPDKEQRAEAKRNCERYLAAGTTLRYSTPARQLCDQIRL